MEDNNENDNNIGNNNMERNNQLEVHQELIEVIPDEDQLVFEELQQIEPLQGAIANIIENVEHQAPPEPVPPQNPIVPPRPGPAENSYKKSNGHHLQSERFFKQTPICIVNDNQDVIEFVHDSINDKFFPDRGSTLIHVDAHPDLLIPKKMPAEEAFDHQKLYLSHNFDRWILPNCYNNIFQKVIWVKPPWSSHIRTAHQTFEIGKNKNTGVIHVNCKENYFIAECLFAPTNMLEDTKTVSLECLTLGNELVLTRDNVDHMKTISYDNHTIPTVLDIDLEFFTTRNPYLYLYEETNAYEILYRLFQFIPPPTKSDEDVEATVKQRTGQLKEIATYFLYCTQGKELPDLQGGPPSAIYALVSELMEEFRLHNYDIKDVDWDMLYDYGHSFGDHEPPHHVSTLAELEVLFESLGKFLDTFVEPPRIITISRSDLENFAFIEAKLLDMLNTKFNCAAAIAYDQGYSVGFDLGNSEVTTDEDADDEDEGQEGIDAFLDYLASGNRGGGADQAGDVDDNVDVVNANLVQLNVADEEEIPQ